MIHLRKMLRFLFLLVITLPLYQCMGQSGKDDKTNVKYTYKTGDPDGIGKWYMGREIAHVMGFQGMSWLERSNREEEENTTKLLRDMAIRSGDSIADIGAGSGYHVFKMATLADKGLIYAVDIQDEMLAALRDKKEAGASKNISIVKGSEKNINLPENSVDKVLMVDVYHEFNYPVAMIASVKKALRPDGKLYLIEYRGEDESVPIKQLHKMTEAQAVKEMKAAGMKLERNIDNLPWQHCMVFVKD
ncbi:Methyltransferase domain-containing protein [Pricia antarctica]|uniref:Methyltransferase domain-containing protein n=1 Tax=Pricia antarctica TaxID=641691 RepID=A0A1G7BWR6_9FLAO|nr:class I SAM-dependent methyltransferase [Pricia antarctica]SDE31459.1 Methyltransferase domain-containing protein [Pricia antarctica]